MKIHGLKIAAAAAIAMFAAAAPAHAADVIDWTTWSNVSGNTITGTTSGGVGVTYTGDFLNLVANYPSWTPSTSYTGGTIGDAPPQSGGIIQLQGGNRDVNTITFSQALLNPVIAIWSLGQGGDTAQFDFNAPFIIEAGGPSAEYGGGSITDGGGNIVDGAEGNGVIQFQGTFTSISFTNPAPEYWYGFTVGNDIGGVPEPATWAMFLLGFGAIGWSLRSPARRAAAVRA
jgi:hypothetical protein